MLQRVERLEGNLEGGPVCPECGGGGSGPVRFVVHSRYEDECPTCGGPCQDTGPDACPGCGRTLRFTLDFDSPGGLEAEAGRG